MNTKQIVILLSVLGLLIVAVVLKQLAPKPDVYKEEGQSLQLGFSADAVDRVEISKDAQEEKVELRRIDGTWRIPSLWNAKADADKIERFMGDFSALKGEIRGDSDALFGDFGIADEEALHVALFQGDSQLLHLLFGTKNAGWQQFFVRKSEASSVFLVNSGLLSEMGMYGDLSDAKPKADVWADLGIFSFFPEAIESVDIKEKGSGWRELGGRLPFERDKDKVLSYLRGLLSLKAKEVVDPSGKGYGFEDPLWQLRLARREGSAVVLTVGAATSEDSTDRYMRLEGAPEAYSVSSYTLERIRVDASRFIGQDPLKIESAAYEMLTVAVPGNEISVSLKGNRWDGLNSYLKALKALQVASVSDLPDRAKENLDTPYRISLSAKQQEDMLTIMCEAPSTDNANNVVCSNQNNDVPFLITGATFRSVFENLDRLKEPETESQKSSADAQAASEGTPEKNK